MEGFVVTTAGSGVEALHAALIQTFDVGVFDIDLPDTSGVVLADDLLELRRVRRAVFFTSDAHPGARARELGPIVHKDGGIEALIAVIHSTLDHMS